MDDNERNKRRRKWIEESGEAYMAEVELEYRLHDFQISEKMLRKFMKGGTIKLYPGETPDGRLQKDERIFVPFLAQSIFNNPYISDIHIPLHKITEELATKSVLIPVDVRIVINPKKFEFPTVYTWELSEEKPDFSVLRKFEGIQNLYLLGYNDNELIEIMSEMRNLKILRIRGGDCFPDPLIKLDLVKLGILGGKFTTIPPDISKMQNLEYLDLTDSKIEVLPPEIGHLKKLKHLMLAMSDLEVLPPEIWHLKNLEYLNISDTKIEVLPPEIGHLKNLEQLHLSDTKIEVLPPEIGHLKNLKHIRLTETQISRLPTEIISMEELRILIIRGSLISELPEGIVEMRNLEKLDISETKIQVLPKNIARMKNLKSLRLKGTLISELPEGIVEMRNLETLDISGTKIQVLPVNIARMKKLKHLYIGKTALLNKEIELKGVRLLK